MIKLETDEFRIGKDEKEYEDLEDVFDLKPYDEIDESYAQSPQMMTVRNQLMNKLGDDFSAIGGSMNPKIIVKYEVDPKIDFEITPNGKNLDVVGRIDKVPDTVHKKKGIAYMRAGNIIYDYIMDFIEDNESEKNEGFKLKIKE